MVYSLVLLVVGCVGDAPPVAMPHTALMQPISLQIANSWTQLQGCPVRPLLDFESNSDLVFIKTNYRITRQEGISHTGQSCLNVDEPQTLKIDLSALLYGQPFPGSWSMLGVASTDYCEMHLINESGSTLATSTLHEMRGKWQLNVLDLTDLSGKLTADNRIYLEIVCKTPLLLDDLILANNGRLFVDSSPVPNGWRIVRSGTKVVVDSPGRFRMTTTNYIPVEVSPLRCRLLQQFKTQQGPAEIVLYPDGRQIADSKLQFLIRDFDTNLQNSFESPCTLDVPEEMGSLDHSGEGFAGSIGYDSRRGVYRMVAKSSNISMTLKPDKSTMARPAFEIRGMPAGKATVIVDGRLIDNCSVRLSDGAWLISLPVAISTTVNIQIRIN